MAGKADFAGARMALTPTTADDGTTTYKLQVDVPGGSSATGPQPAASSQSVTPASDGNPFRTVLLNPANSNNPVETTIDGNPLGEGQGGFTQLRTYSHTAIWDGAASLWFRTPGNASGAFVRPAPATVVINASGAASGTIATSGGTAALTMTAATKSEVINSSTATLWASWGTPAVNGAGSFPILTGGSYTADRVAGTLTLLSTAANQPYTVNRFSF